MNEKTLTFIAKMEKVGALANSLFRAYQSRSQLDERSGQPKVVQDGSKKAILLSYMRGGTTFVGSTFERNKDVFYVFEPEWSLLFQTINEYQPLQNIDGTLQ